MLFVEALKFGIITIEIMKMYKFKDSVDGNYAFVIAGNLQLARKKVENLTSVPFHFIEAKDLEDLPNPIVVYNTILPF